MIDPRTPIEQIAEMCNSMEDLGNLFNQCNFEKNKDDDIPISPKLLQEAISKTNHLKTVTKSDIQKLLRIGYPKASKLYDLITYPKNNDIRDLYEFIRTHLLVTVYGDTLDAENAISDTPTISAVKAIDGKISDTVTVSLDESEKKKLTDFFVGSTIIGYGTQLNYFHKLCDRYNIKFPRSAIDIAEFAQEPSSIIGKSEEDFFAQLKKYNLPKPNNPIQYCRAAINLLFSYAKTQSFYQYLQCVYDLRIEP